MKYFIQTFGCQANKADSERIAGMLESRGMIPAVSLNEADHVVINTCMIRESAENRVYGLVNNLSKRKLHEPNLKIVVTGCMIGMAARDKTGKFMQKIRDSMPAADEFLPIEEVGFDNAPIRTNSIHAWVPISNGCNNFCTFCVVPITRGREISRPFHEIIREIEHLAHQGYKEITLVGQNVNSYGADLVLGQDNVQVLRDLDAGTFFQKEAEVPKNSTTVVPFEGYKLPNGVKIAPVFVKHLGRLRIPTLFPFLLEEVCKIQTIEKVDFISSNPWDFTDELIETIKKNKKIVRHLHFALQSGDNEVLKRMNRWYSREEYIGLVSKIRAVVPNMTFSTDIIVGFCGETKAQFQNTVQLVRQIGFSKAYISMYSDRPMTAAHKVYDDNVPHIEKKRRWKILDKLINQTNLNRGTYTIDQHSYRKTHKPDSNSAQVSF
ncbi:MAG: MiaB/RimO family radical SAM methylthiotransferase [Patescibacteria group bacterium]